MKSKKCGAKARTNANNPCRNLGMKNGRCRLHGGLSTGPKTLDGIQKIKKSITKHGFYSKEAVAERRALSILLKRI